MFLVCCKATLEKKTASSQKIHLAVVLAIE
jgi:hypothetical protein